MINQGRARYPVHEAVIHCSATRPNWMAAQRFADKVAEIRRWHVQERGWRAIGYHWLIDRDGKVAAGRAETEVGAGVAGHNRGVIHICLLGGHGSSADDWFSDNFTPEQNVALRLLLSQIGQRTDLRRITGHNDHANKACPGFRVETWLRSAPPVVSSPRPAPNPRGNWPDAR